MSRRAGLVLRNGGTDAVSETPQCSQAECEALVDRFLPPLSELPDEVRAELHDGSAAPGRASPAAHHAALELLGCCLWDIFSHNHDVTDADGRAYHLGSFRGTGDFLADRMAVRYPDDPGFDYIDFYMGTRGVDGHVAVYEWIFRGLREAGCDWIYSFPRIHLLRLGDPAPADAGDSDDEAIREFAASLDRAHEDAVRKARHRPLPAVVAAYRRVYGRLPEGWPHTDM